MAQTASVAMAAYNGQRFIAQQIDSILAELDLHDELVVSCDESTDDTWDILREYAQRDPRIKIFKNRTPGIVGNFNNAIDKCNGDVVFISDQDDVWVQGKRNKMIDALAENDADLAIHNVVHVDENGRTISKPLFEEYGIGPGLFRNFAKPRYSGCCMAFTAEAKKKIFPMPESVVNYDHWIGMVCEVFGNVVFIDDVLLKHRLHGGNVTTARRPFSVIAKQRLNLLCELVKRKRALP